MIVGVLRCVLCAAALSIVGACAPTEAAFVPTVTLVPPTSTPVVTLPPPTPTRADLLNPADLAPTAALAHTAAILPSAPLPATDVDELRAVLARALGTQADLVRWVSAEAAAWPFASTRCYRPVADGRVVGRRVFFLVGTTVYEFQQHGDAPYRLCRETTQARDALLLAVDPVATELTTLAQRAAANQLGISVRRVAWVSVTAHRWWDTSLGCPAPNVRYQPADVPGYRIVLQAGGARYAFHSDAERLFPCPLGREVLMPPTAP